MRLTDEEKWARVRTFFKEQLVPVAEKLRSSGIRFFPLAFEGETTWYTKYAAPTPELDEFRDEEVELRLRRLWGAMPDLAQLADPLVQLAKELEAEPDDTGQVSDFIYEMF